jgi:hypothetical protein
MGESFAGFLWLAVTIGLAVPLVPFAKRLARQSINGGKDLVLVIALLGVLLYVSFPIASVIGSGFALIVYQLIVSPFLRTSNIGQGAIAFLFVWVVALFCIACLAAQFINNWWNKRFG